MDNPNPDLVPISFVTIKHNDSFLITPKRKNRPVNIIGSSSSESSVLSCTPKRPKKKSQSVFRPRVDTSTHSLSTTTTTSTPKSSPSRLLFASMAVIHRDISHSYSTTSLDLEHTVDDTSLIQRNDYDLKSNEGLEVILHLDQSLSYKETADAS